MMGMSSCLTSNSPNISRHMCLPHRTTNPSTSTSTSTRRRGRGVAASLSLASHPIIFALALATLCLTSILQVSGQTCDYKQANDAPNGSGFIQSDKPSALSDVSFPSQRTTWSAGTVTFNTGPQAGTSDNAPVLGINARRRIDSGFEVKFSYQYKGGNADGSDNNGFALVISTQNAILFTPAARENLGYGGSSNNALAIEFDCKQDTNIGDSGAPHIAVQSSVPLGVLTAGSGATVVKPVLSSGLSDLCKPSASPRSVSVMYSPLTGISVSISGLTSTPLTSSLTRDVRQAFSSGGTYLPVYFGFTMSVDVNSKSQLQISGIEIRTLGADPSKAIISSKDSQWGIGKIAKLGVNDQPTPLNQAGGIYPPDWMPRVYVVDFCGNRQGIGGAPARFSARLLGANGNELANNANNNGQGAYLDNDGQWIQGTGADGSYPIQIFSRLTGTTFSLEIKLVGQSTIVGGKPYDVQFIAGDLSVTQTAALVGITPVPTNDFQPWNVLQTSEQLRFVAGVEKTAYIFAVDKFRNPIPYSQKPYSFYGQFLPAGQGNTPTTSPSIPPTDTNSHIYTVKLSYNIVGSGSTAGLIPLSLKLASTTEDLRGNQLNNIPKYQNCTIGPGPINPAASRFDSTATNTNGVNNLLSVVAGQVSTVYVGLYDGIVSSAYPSGNPIETPPADISAYPVSLTLQLNNDATVSVSSTSPAVWDTRTRRLAITYTTTKVGVYKFITATVQGKDIMNKNNFQPLTQAGPTSGPKSFAAIDLASNNPPATGTKLGTAISGTSTNFYITAADSQGNTGQAMTIGSEVECILSSVATPTATAKVICREPTGTNPTNNNNNLLSAIPTCSPVGNPPGKYRVTMIPALNGDYSINCTLKATPNAPTPPIGTLAPILGNLLNTPYTLTVTPDGPNADKSIVTFPLSTDIYEVQNQDDPASVMRTTGTIATSRKPIKVTLELKDKYGNPRPGDIDDSNSVAVSLVSIDRTPVVQTQNVTKIPGRNQYEYTIYIQNAGEFLVQVQIPRGTTVPGSLGPSAASIFVQPGPIVQAPTAVESAAGTIPIGSNSVMGGAGLLTAGLAFTLGAQDRFKNTIPPKNSQGANKYGNMYEPAIPTVSINPQGGGVQANPPMGTSGDLWSYTYTIPSSNTPSSVNFVVKGESNTNIYSFDVKISDKPPPTNADTDLCATPATAGVSKSFKIGNLQDVTNAGGKKYNLVTDPYSQIFFKNDAAPTGNQLGTGTWNPTSAGVYRIRLFVDGTESNLSSAGGSVWNCTVNPGGISGSRSSLSYVPSVIAGVSFNISVTFRDVGGDLIKATDQRYPILDKTKFTVKTIATTPTTGNIIDLNKQGDILIITVVMTAAGTAPLSVTYLATPTATSVEIKSQQQIVISPNSPASASADQSPSLRDLIVQAGQTAIISNIELKDQYGNIIGKMIDLCVGCRLYVSIGRRVSSNFTGSSQQLFPVTVTFPNSATQQATVAFTPTISDYTKLSVLGWYVSDIPSTYKPSFNGPNPPVDELTPIPSCDPSSTSPPLYCVGSDVSGIMVVGTSRHMMSGTMSFIIAPGTPSSIASQPIKTDNTIQKGDNYETTVTAGQTTQFRFIIKDAFGNGWRGVSGPLSSWTPSNNPLEVKLEPQTTQSANAILVTIPANNLLPDETQGNAGQGIYTGSFNIKYTGKWATTISAAAIIVFSSTSTTTYINVEAGLAFPPTTLLSVPIPSRIPAGVRSSAFVTLRDQFENVLQVSSLNTYKVDVEFYLQDQSRRPDDSLINTDWKPCTAGNGFIKQTDKPQPQKVDNITISLKNGRFEVGFLATKIGSYYAWLKVSPGEMQLDPATPKNSQDQIAYFGNANPKPKPTDPSTTTPCTLNQFVFTVSYGPISPPHCTIDGPGVESARVLVPTTFSITLRDAYGNQIGIPYRLDDSNNNPNNIKLPVVRAAADTVELSCGLPKPPTTQALDPTSMESIVPTDNGDGSATFKYTPKTAGTVYISVALDTNFINVRNQIIDPNTPLVNFPDPIISGRTLLGNPSCRSFRVYASFTDSITSTQTNSTIATVPASIDVTGFDEYSNRVDFGRIGYKMTIIRRQDQLPVEVFQTEFISTYNANLLLTSQIQNVPYIASWEGTYDVVIRQDPTDKDDNKNNRTIAPYLWQMTVTPAKCSASSPSTPFRCGAGGQCRASQADCPASTCTGPASATYCNGGCTTDCNKPTLPTGLIYTDLYATNSSGAAGGAGAVIAISTCPDGGLRSSTTDCPTRRQCPAGWIMCQTDHYTCVSVAAGVGACPPAPTCPAGWFACPNGRCATRAENCGGDVTCPTGLVLCPDGSCQSNRGACQEILSCDRYPHPVTPSKFQVGCASGTCRGEWADCPVPRACPSGWTLCSNGQCQPSLSQCSAPAVCAPSEHRCGDGTCRQNHLLCPSQATCPIGQVQCSDGECVSDVSFCRIPRPCPSTRPVYCPDGSCASNITACATTKTCPLTSPTLCADGSCATSLSACVSTLACPSHMDVRCPDGTCRSSLESCPTMVRCPPQAPVRCSDGRCAPAPEVCTSPLVLTCPENAPVRCPSGECSASLIQCPTPMTCPASQQRCVDGTCRGSCDVGIIKEALQRCKDPRAPVTCPNSHMGVSCAASLSECPTSRTCPWNLPVRCADQSCAVSIEECPPAINLLSSQFGCAGGSIAGALGACGTSVTCPPQVPVKCWDESCRVVAEDCPPPPRCPRDTKSGSNDDAPFLCSDGSCVSSLGGCKTSGSCPRDLPVKCSWFRTALNPDALTIGDEISDTASCARSIGECINLLGNEQSITDDGKKSLPQNSPNRAATTQATRTRGDCPSGRAVRTHTGACVASTTYTGVKICPLHAPYQCPGGLCVRGSVRGFPDPVMSPDDISSCPTEDQLREQCPPNQIRCHDGSCAPSKDECIDQYDTYNACPASRPYRCESGFCAISSTRCPIIPEVVTESCPASTPVRCADWSCRELAIQCPVVKPCYIRYNKDGATSVTNLTRCADATCPDPTTGQCSSTGITSTTQLNRRCPSGRERCANGLCAILGSCVDEQLPNSQGCPVTPQGAVTRCSSNGYCSSSATNCPAALKPTNGCINPDHIKCWDGSCAESLSKCERAPNGCPAARPVLCASGDCAATPSSCSAGSTCTNGGVRCPSGVCASSYSACEIRGCPSDKPVRCADGTCKPLRAQFSTTGNPFNADTMCIPTVVCPSREPYMCADGSCVASTRLCRPVYECAAGFVYCPYTTSCLSTADAKKCPTPDNVRSKDATEPVCPAANPTLCPDGACRRTAAECHDFRLNPRCDIGKVQCWDGTCETSYQACISRGVLLRRGIPTIGSGADKKPVTLVQRGGEQMPLLPYDLLIDETVACPTGAKFVCPDGDCVTDRKLCHAIASCPSTIPQRCWDGSCVNSTISACPPSPTPTGPACSSGVRCEDGVCRNGDYGSCPLAANCPANNPGGGLSYYCAGLISNPCVSDRSTCIERLNNAPSVCQDRCERDNIVRVTPVSLPAPGTSPRDIQVDVSFDSQNVLRTQVIVPAGAVPGRVVTFQTMRGETPRRRKVPSNNPTPYDREDVELLSTPFTCSVDGRDEPTILTNPWNVYGAIDRKAYALNNGPTGSANGNDAGNTVVPCEYQGEFTALGTSPWSIDNSVNVPQTRGDVSISPNTIVINLDQSLDTLSLSGDLTAFDISPASGFKRWIPNQQQGFICLCFNITSSERIPKPTSIRGYRDYPGYNVEENYKVGSYFCAKMSRTSNPKDSTITLLSYVVQPSGGAQQLTCPTSGQPDIRTLSVTHKPKSVDCGLTATGATSSAGDNGLIRGSNICLASYNVQRGEWSCTESDEVFFWNFQEGLDQAGQERYRGFVLSPSYKELVKYRAWDPSLGLPITRAQGSIKICDPNVPYAFAQFQAPLPSIPPTPECDLWCKYWRVILGVVLGVGIFTCLAAFAIFRLVRYRRKYKEKQEHLRDLKDRAMELDQYHGGLGVDGGDDDDIHMMANPLVIEMQDLELQIRKVEQDMNVQGDTERLQIDQLEMERQRLYAEIQRVKEAMQKQNVTTGAPSRTSVAPAALGGYAGNTTAPLPGQMYTGGQSQQRLVPNQPQSESTIHHEFGQVRRPAKKKDF